MKIFKLKKFSAKELAALYEKSPKSFRRWIKHLEPELGPRHGWDYSPDQIKVIVSALGLPGGYMFDENTEKQVREYKNSLHK